MFQPIDYRSHPGQSFPLSLCGPNSISRANAHMVYGLKHQHFTLHPITLFQPRLLKLHGRWKTDAAKDMYVHEDVHKRLEITKYLGL